MLLKTRTNITHLSLKLLCQIDLHMGLAPNPSNVILTQYLNGWWSTRPELNAGSHMVAGVCVLYMSILT